MNKKYFSENYHKFSTTLFLSMKISRLASGRNTEWNKFWACLLFTKLCVIGKSMHLIASDSILDNKDSHWDFSSLFGLTRNIMECYQTMFYLCVDNIPDDERLARKKLFDLHDYYERKRLHSNLDDLEDKELESYVVNELTTNKYFMSLEEKERKKYLKGNQAFFKSREEIEELYGRSRKEFRALYQLFSSYTHSYPIGFYGMYDGERGTGVASETEIAYSGLALETTEWYLRQGAMHMCILFADIKKILTEEEIEILK
jgi:hypothetical protein